jgi:hypothetical protein
MIDDHGMPWETGHAFFVCSLRNHIASHERKRQASSYTTMELNFCERFPLILKL